MGILIRAQKMALAAKFAESWKDETYERGEAQTFYNDFFQVFGIERRSRAFYEMAVKKFDDRQGYIDLFWPSVLLAEHKSTGYDLKKAMKQAGEYFVSLKDSERPRYLLACDFQRFYLVDVEEKKEYRFGLHELPKHIGLFNFMEDGRRGPDRITSDPVNTEASEMMGSIFDSLKETGYPSGDTEYLLTRLAFCLFADDTGIFEDGVFEEYLKKETAGSGADLGPKINQLFQIMNTPVERRQTNLDASVAQFPYIDGELFRRSIMVPAFDFPMRRLLISACGFDWSKVSPAIFGSLFQSVMDKKKRRREGAHYTAEENIMKVIRPLFLDALEAEMERILACKSGNRRRNLERFQERLAGLTFFDPACGSGNFLIIAYRELRRIELKVILELNDPQDNDRDVPSLSRVDVDQFFGIEINKFSAKIAEIAIWMMDHMMNTEIGAKYGTAYTRIPLRKSPSIRQADAMEIDWNDVLPASECSYILGNPPFGGPKHATAEHRRQTRATAGHEKGGGTLDYVAGWFLKASEYANDSARIGLVATNSITQGEQVGQLWPSILDKYDMEITFAYRSFKWLSEAKGKANVSVVILGLAKKGTVKLKRLFDHDGGNILEDRTEIISPYLFGTEKIILVKDTEDPRNGFPPMRMGSKPIDKGNYIFKEEEVKGFLKIEPEAGQFLRKYKSADDFIKGKTRWILALHDASPAELNRMPEVKRRMQAVREFRLKSTDRGTRKLAETPTLYHLNVLPSDRFLAIPATSSETRKYVPIDFMDTPTIPSNAIMIVENASLGLFGLLTSSMHMVWLREIGGRLETRLRYSKGVVYNTFPVPDGSLDVLESYAKKILDIRAMYVTSTFADMYNPLTMPPDLKKAHRALDRKVERLYRKTRKTPFASDQERIDFLLERYHKTTKTTTNGRQSSKTPPNDS